jgi:hypothetical protein
LVFGDSEGGVGNTTGSSGFFDLFFSEVSTSGTVLWTEQYGSAEADLAFDLVIDPSNSAVYATGMTSGILDSTPGVEDPPAPQVFTLRLNASTRTLNWVRQTGPFSGQSGESLALTNEGVGTLFYTNGSFSGVTNNSRDYRSSDDMVVAHYSPTGQLQWLYQFDQTAERIFARAISFIGSQCFVLQDHVYVADAPFGTTSLDRFTVPISTAAEPNAALPLVAYSAYPNPAAEQITVRVEGGESLRSVALLDTRGGLVYEKQLSPTNEASLPVGEVARGVYLLRVQTIRGTFTSRVFLR